MPLFCIIGFDEKNAYEKRQKFLEPHLDALKAMNQSGRLFSAGPLMVSQENNEEYFGSVLIIDFENQQQAEDWFYKEPYYLAGVYKEVTIKPYLDAMPYC